MKDKEQLVSQNIGLVHFVIKRFSGRGQDMEELFQDLVLWKFSAFSSSGYRINR